MAVFSMTMSLRHLREGFARYRGLRKVSAPVTLRPDTAHVGRCSHVNTRSVDIALCLYSAFVLPNLSNSVLLAARVLQAYQTGLRDA